MKLSTKSTYGLRAMLAISLSESGGVTSIADISKAEGISVPYLEQLLNRLRRKGLIESIRGPKGGYVLSKPPKRITVGEIVKALEGNISPVHCVAAGKGIKSICKKESSCAPRVVWARLANAIDECLESITLEDLRGEAEKAMR